MFIKFLKYLLFVFTVCDSAFCLNFSASYIFLCSLYYAYVHTLAFFAYLNAVSFYYIIICGINPLYRLKLPIQNRSYSIFFYRGEDNIDIQSYAFYFVAKHNTIEKGTIKIKLTTHCFWVSIFEAKVHFFLLNPSFFLFCLNIISIKIYMICFRFFSSLRYVQPIYNF